MRRTAGLLILLSSGAWGRPPAPEVAAPEAPLEEIVVVGRRGAQPPPLDAVAYYKRHCFDAPRRTGRFAPPADDPAWEPLNDKVRAQFGVTDPDVPAYSLVDDARARTLVIKFEQLRLPQNLVEDRCTLAILGGDDHARLIAQVSKLFGGPGTQRHVGHAAGVERIPGWRQTLWTGRPQRGSRRWRVNEADGAAKAGGTWTVVTDIGSFYASNDYILGDLKTRHAPGRSLSVLTFARTTRNP